MLFVLQSAEKLTFLPHDPLNITPQIGEPGHVRLIGKTIKVLDVISQLLDTQLRHCRVVEVGVAPPGRLVVRRRGGNILKRLTAPDGTQFPVLTGWRRRGAPRERCLVRNSLGPWQLVSPNKRFEAFLEIFAVEIRKVDSVCR